MSEPSNLEEDYKTLCIAIVQIANKPGRPPEDIARKAIADIAARRGQTIR